MVVLPEGGKGAKDSTLKAFVAAAESTTGVEGTVDHSSLANPRIAAADGFLQ